MSVMNKLVMKLTNMPSDMAELRAFWRKHSDVYTNGIGPFVVDVVVLFSNVEIIITCSYKLSENSNKCNIPRATPKLITNMMTELTEK